MGLQAQKLRAQKFVAPSKVKQFSITINSEDCTIKTQMLNHQKNIVAHNDRTYLWYSSQKLMETNGGYEGKLIHGYFKSFYLNNQLKEQGNVWYGLKNKKWRYWYRDGRLREIINWKKGKKSGEYLLFNDVGLLMAKGYFKNDKLHGTFYAYGSENKIIEKKKYKNGIEIVRKKRLNRKEVKKVEGSIKVKKKKNSIPKKERKGKIKVNRKEKTTEKPIAAK